MKTLYIPELPKEIPCWYCGQPCPKFHRDQILFSKLVEAKGDDYSKVWEYHCHNHRDLDIEVTCAKHEITPPQWFFNRIAIAYKNLQLHWNFYSGNRVSLRARKNEHACWEAVSLREWPPKFQTYDPDILYQSPEKIRQFLKLYRVFS